jgi:hypothetical protein
MGRYTHLGVVRSKEVLPVLSPSHDDGWGPEIGQGA